jgi:ferredoxin
MAYLDQLASGGRPVEICPQDEVGLLDLDAVLTAAPADSAVYCCGPEGLLHAVEQRVPVDRLHLERFAPKPVTGAETAFEVTLASSGRAIPVPAGCSILAALEADGVPVLSSCQEGTCGTCETGVLEGVPDHRDSVLTAAEQAAGDVMMICVSRAVTPRLVLDL